MSKNFGKATDLIDFSRSSGGTALRKISYGPELVTNGTFDTDTSGWTAGTNVTLSAIGGNLRIERGASVNQNNYTTVATTVGAVYEISWEYKGRSSGSNHYTDIRVGPSAGSVDYYRALDSSSSEFAQGTSAGVFVATGTTAYVTALVRDGVSGDYIEIDNVSVKEVLFDQADGDLVVFNHPADIPRIEYAADGSVKGLLVEEARTNLLTYSADFSTGWSKQSVTVTANTIAAPDGSLTADTVNLQDNGNSAIYKSAAVTAGTYTLSVWLKVPTGTEQLRLAAYNATDGLRTKDITVTTDWQRFEFAVTPTAVDNLYPILNRLSSPYVGDIYIWGAQAEAGAFPTSYIPTSGATATRSADVASIATSAFGYRQAEGTVVVEFDSNGSDGADYPRVFSLSNSAGTDLSRFLINPTNTTTVAVLENSVGVALAGWSGSISPNTEEKVAVSIKKDSFAASLSGASTQTDTSGDVPAAADLLTIGTQSNLGNNYLNGHIKSIKYYPRRLTNAQLQELST